VTKKAQAEASAKKALAEGDKALQMVPVEVAKEQVGVKQREVEVLQQELEARAQNASVAQQFELEKLRIAKEAEIRIAGAQATFGGKIEATVVGTPEDVSRMTASYMKGMGVARVVDGFFAGASDETLESLDGVAQTLASLVNAAARRIGARPEEVAAAASAALPKVSGDGKGGATSTK
jgi:hypothetical protein